MAESNGGLLKRFVMLYCVFKTLPSLKGKRRAYEREREKCKVCMVYAYERQKKSGMSPTLASVSGLLANTIASSY